MLSKYYSPRVGDSTCMGVADLGVLGVFGDEAEEDGEVGQVAYCLIIESLSKLISMNWK